MTENPYKSLELTQILGQPCDFQVEETDLWSDVSGSGSWSEADGGEWEREFISAELGVRVRTRRPAAGGGLMNEHCIGVAQIARLGPTL